MIARGTGVILAFGGGGPQTLPGLGGFQTALDALGGCGASGPSSWARTASAWSP